MSCKYTSSTYDAHAWMHTHTHMYIHMHTRTHAHTHTLVFTHTDLSSLKYVIVIKVNTHKTNPYKSYTNNIIIYYDSLSWIQ